MRAAESAVTRALVAGLDEAGWHTPTPAVGWDIADQISHLAYFDEVTVQSVVGRVDTGDALVDPVTVDMPYTGTAAGGDHVFATTAPLPVAGSVGYTVRVLPHHPMLASEAELGLVTLA